MSKHKPEFLKQKYRADEIDYKECRFVVHMANAGTKQDWHMVKEVLHLKDGTKVPNIRYIADYKRKYWISSPRMRGSYTQKKEYEYLKNLVEGESTQRDLYKNVARALGEMGLMNQPHKVRDHAHVFGLDITSTTEIKYKYFKEMRDKNKNHTPFNIAYSDTETNMLNWDKGAGKGIIMQSLFFERKLYTVVLKSFLGTVPNPVETLKELYEEHMPQQGKDEVDEWVVELVDNPIDIVKRILLKCHDWKPDFLSFWNALFDMEKMIECIEEAGYRPEDVFCDPNLPKELRYFFFKKAKPNKTSASGRLMSKRPEDQWHTLFCPASFYLVDQMATYRFIRKSKQAEKSMSLDAILLKELGAGLGKLRHKPADGLIGADFHVFMQQKYPAEYVIYNLWDTVCMHLLTLKTKDLDFTLPGTCEFSDFQFFESEPKRYVQKFHFWALEKKEAVSGVGGSSLVQEYDDKTFPTKDNIITLEPHLLVTQGMRLFDDYPNLVSEWHMHSGDLDVKSSYPYGQICFSMSRRTTVREILKVEGVDTDRLRLQGLNLSGGSTNAVEFCTEMFKMPGLSEWSKKYDELEQT